MITHLLLISPTITWYVRFVGKENELNFLGDLSGRYLEGAGVTQEPP